MRVVRLEKTWCVLVGKSFWNLAQGRPGKIWKSSIKTDILIEMHREGDLYAVGFGSGYVSSHSQLAKPLSKIDFSTVWPYFSHTLIVCNEKFVCGCPTSASQLYFPRARCDRIIWRPCIFCWLYQTAVHFNIKKPKIWSWYKWLSIMKKCGLAIRYCPNRNNVLNGKLYL
jgi:hypothetical protein